MPSHRKRFRIEGAAGVDDRRAWAASHAVEGVPARASADPAWIDADRLGADLHAMRAAISATKREVADLQRAPAGAGAIQRAAGELDEVSVATERATTTILGAVEEIELAANLLRQGQPAGGRQETAEHILDRVLVLYEACNFQDIAGQRIRKVVTTLKFVEDRLDRMIAALGPAAPDPSAEPPAVRNVALLGGPSLPGEAGHVSQSEVDAYFS